MINAADILEASRIRCTEIIAKQTGKDSSTIILVDQPSPSYRALCEILVEAFNKELVNYSNVIRQPDTKISWAATLARLEVGDKISIQNKSQDSVASACAKHNKNGKRFVTKRVQEVVYVYRVA